MNLDDGRDVAVRAARSPIAASSEGAAALAAEPGLGGAPAAERSGHDPASWDILAAALNARGVRHVAPASRGIRPPRIDDEELYAALFRSPDPRLQEAAIGLLLVRPMSAVDAERAISRLDGALRDRAARRHTTAAALQRLWRTRLVDALGPHVLIGAVYASELGAPPVDEDFGYRTLAAVARGEQERYGYNAWDGYHSFAGVFLAHLEMERRRA